MKEIILDGVRFLPAPDGIRSPWELEQQRLTDWLRDHSFDRAERTVRHLVLFTGKKSVIFRCTWSDLFDSCASLGLALTVIDETKDWVVQLDPPPAPTAPDPGPKVSKTDEGIASKILEYFPLGSARPRLLSEVIRQVKEQRGYTKLICARAFALLEDTGRIRKTPDGLWYQVPAAVVMPPGARPDYLEDL